MAEHGSGGIKADCKATPRLVRRDEDPGTLPGRRGFFLNLGAQKGGAMKQNDPYRRLVENRPIVTEIDQRWADEYHRLSMKLCARHLLPNALAGERWASLLLIEHCSEAIRDNCRIPTDVATWLAEGMLHIARGDSIEEAFNIARRGKGKSKEGAAAVDRSRQYCMAYQAACLLHDNQKQAHAFSAVADKHGLSVDTVEAAWKKFRAGAERAIRLQLEQLGKVIRI